jgi:hypothetical protein
MKSKSSFQYQDQHDPAKGRIKAKPVHAKAVKAKPVKK